MNEIENMYENARVCKIKKNIKCTTVEYLDCETWQCPSCDKYVQEYPPFTAEKQINLIKWLSNTDYYIHNIYKTIDTGKYCIENCCYDLETDKFEDTLARLINKLWQDLTEEEKQQIKEILE